MGDNEYSSTTIYKQYLRLVMHHLPYFHDTVRVPSRTMNKNSENTPFLQKLFSQLSIT